MIPVTIEEKQSYYEQSICLVYKKELNTNDKVSDHCHYTGSYSGALYMTINL